MNKQMAAALVQPVYSGGEGPDLLMLHGFGADRLSWIGIAPALHPLVQCWMLDLPGHGESLNLTPAATLSELVSQIDTTALDNADRSLHLMGHSMGGALCLLLAARNPQAIASMTLIAPSGLGQGVNHSFIEQYPLASDSTSLRGLLEMLVCDTKMISELLVDYAFEQLNKKTTREALSIVARAIRNSSDELESAKEKVIQADIPRLVVWGQQDQINPVMASNEQLFGGQWLHVPQCGHIPHVESRKLVCDTMAEFLAAQIN